ncbi:MAG TPA: helical backbone metal receptor [Bacteroidia bacterium]|jgi:ABC-type Fe3+-hydroxamate transport system substrate-binding protein|nr:helical backbone metal receptor [Bacteroidia bacterium]
MQATDQLNRTIEFSFPPKRIISLVPSQSELLWYLGLQKELIGITKFCIHPGEMFRSVTRVGGTKELKSDIIKKLQPDLIIANKEENEQEQIEEFCKHYPVWISDIYNIKDALQMILKVGEITDRKNESVELVNFVQLKYNKFRNHQLKIVNPKVAYLIWKNPYMAAGHNTFINYLLGECGFINIFTNEKSRYPEITTQMIIDKNPDFIFLSSEPYPFKQKHIEELQKHLPDTKIILVDGEMFSWYGNRLLYTFDYFEDLLLKILPQRH